MHALIHFVLFGCALSAPQWYNSQDDERFRVSMNGGGSYEERIFGRGGNSFGVYTSNRRHGGGQPITLRPRGYTNSGTPGGNCPPGQVRHVGSCDIPEVKKWLYVYGPPPTTTTVGPPPNIPKPKINFNLVFVHAPEYPEKLEPIIVPPPQQKTVLYVLSKDGEEGQQVIEIPAGPKELPKVFFVNYNKGENPSLPGGLTLQEALISAIPQDSQTIDGHENGNGNGNMNNNENFNGYGNDEGYGGGGGSEYNQSQMYFPK